MPHKPLPALTAAQRQAGLARGTARRVHRAQLLDAVRAGETDLSGFLAPLDDATTDPVTREVIARTRIRHALLALPRVGRATADRVLAELGWAHDRRFTTVSPKQRQKLITTVTAFRDTRQRRPTSRPS